MLTQILKTLSRQKAVPHLIRFVPYSRQHLLLDFVLLLLELAHSLLSSSFCSHTFLMWIAPSCYEGLSKFCMFLRFSPFLQSLDDSLYHRNGQMISQFCLNHSHAWCWKAFQLLHSKLANKSEIGWYVSAGERDIGSSILESSNSSPEL